MSDKPDFEIVLVSSGHQALDHRVFHKEAVSLARHFTRVRVVASHSVPEVIERIQITPMPVSRNRLERFLWRPLQCYRAVRGPGRNRLLILHDAELLFWAPLVRLLTGWRIVYDVHEDFAQLLLRRQWIPSALRDGVSRWVRLLEHLCSRSCDGIIGVTEVLVSAFPHRRQVAVYNLPSLDFFHQASACAFAADSRMYDIVHLGTLSEERLDFLCAVLFGIRERKPDARALIIGVRPDQVKVLRERFTGDWVTIMGNIPYRDIASLLCQCQIGIDVHPILYPHLRCAVPVKVFEYMAAGCNVITSYLPELSRLLGTEGGEHVVVLKSSSAADFAEAVANTLQDPEAMHEHQLALIHAIETQWNWVHEERKFIDFISTLLEDLHWVGKRSSCRVLPITGEIGKETVSSE